MDLPPILRQVAAGIGSRELEVLGQQAERQKGIKEREMKYPSEVLSAATNVLLEVERCKAYGYELSPILKMAKDMAEYVRATKDSVDVPGEIWPQDDGYSCSC